MKNLLLIAFLLFSLHVSSQDWELHGNGHIKNTNPGHVAIGGGNALDFVNLAVGSTTTSASQIPAHGWWNLYNSARTTHTGSASKLWGAYFLTRLGSAGSLEEMISVYADIGIDNNAGGVITDAYGVKVNMFQRSGTITNGYGLFINDIEATNQYGVYQAGTNDKNFFAGKVSIGADNTGDHIKLRVSDNATSPSDFPSYGKWNFFSYGSTTHTGTASKLWGAYLLSLNGGSGTLTESVGVNAVAGNESSSGGTVTNAYGVQAGVQKGVGTVNNGYGVYIKDVAATNQYGLYQAGTNDKNYFAGDVGVGAEAFDGVNFYVRSDATNASEIPSYGLWGMFSYSSWSGSSSTSGSVFGGKLISLNNHSGTLQNSYGLDTAAGNESSGTGTVVNAYGIQTGVDKGNGTVANGYGLYIRDVRATNQYGIYQEGANDKNYFAGSIAIGTNDPKGYKLAVNGNAIATEIKVKTFGTWPDYVFNKDYNLTDLEEVEQYIKANGHLSNIPSAEEVKENEGIELGEMNVKLLQKIEELTLYTIEQEKEIKEFKKVADRNEKLEGKVAKLEKLVEQLINTQK